MFIANQSSFKLFKKLYRFIMTKRENISLNQLIVKIQRHFIVVNTQLSIPSIFLAFISGLAAVRIFLPAVIKSAPHSCS